MSWQLITPDEPWSYGCYLVTVRRMLSTGPEKCVTIGTYTEFGWIDEDMDPLPATHWMPLPEAAP
jgi:hypothetical protein